MSRFVRASKYRHTFGQPARKEHGYDNVKVTNSAWDTNIIACSTKYISVNWNSAGGGAFTILPLPTPFATPGETTLFPGGKLPDVLPLARGHTAAVLDTDWSPFDDDLVASAGEDGKVMLWRIPEPAPFSTWGGDKWAPTQADDFDPILRIDASGRKIGQVTFNPTASSVLASASADHTIKLWDLGAPEQAKTVLSGHTDGIQSVAWSPDGSLLATTARDRKIRLFDPRLSGDKSCVIEKESHGGIKAARVCWLGSTGRLATTGFSKMSDRQVSLYDASTLDKLTTLDLDQSAGVIMPFYSDNGILFLAGKGDGNIRYYEVTPEDELFHLSEYSSSVPQRGMTFLPRRALSISDCEIARAYKVHTSGIEPIAFIVPRRSDSFQSDIFPPAPAAEPSTNSTEWFSGERKPPRLVALDSGVVSGASATAQAAIPVPQRQATIPVPEKQATLPPPSATTTAPPPAPAPVPVPTPVVVAAAPAPTTSAAPSSTEDNSALAGENARLTSELRAANTKIRELELKVEALKANAQKVVDLLGSGI